MSESADRPQPGAGVPDWLGALAPVESAALSDGARVDALIGLQRVQAWASAQQYRLLAVMAEPGDPPQPGNPSRPGDPAPAAVADKQYRRDEISCALRLPAAQVTGLLHTAHELTRRLPPTLALLERGDISTRHAEVLVTAVNHLPDHAAVAVQECVLPRAPRQTVPRFRDCVRRAVITVDPRDAEQRHTDAATGRGVWKHLDNDGMGELTARLTADGLMTVMDRLDAIASVRLPGDERSADQRRADALVALAVNDPVALATNDPVALAATPTWHGRRPVVQVTVALSTLLALDENPGELTGYGPIPVTVARRIAADPSGTWRRLVTDPRGRLLDYGRTTYTPPQDLTDFVVAHDGVCRFPTSNVPARRCELDHDIAWDDGGTTCPENLTAKTSRHHHLKHEAGWTVTRDRVTGVVTWRTPTGHTYTDHPAEHPRDHTVDRVGPPADPPDDADPPPF